MNRRDDPHFARQCSQKLPQSVAVPDGLGGSKVWPIALDGMPCLFYGRVRPSGVCGPTTDIYICPACVDLTYEIVHGRDDEEAPHVGV